ncbi:MAG: neutral/alkaline non-lysosomal ceramidase N-terminal domain-containing protein [Verrucomicrobia bacterium]|nr:neutral/alkaline non-lysosomal ceramidase N-terminal domain-containing protein [Verrucomicrobiota bacterium]
MKRVLVLLLASAGVLHAADFEAGVAKIKITPPTPFWMSGYANRSNQSVGVVQDLWAKALALRDPQGHRAVIVTTDLIGLHHSVSDEVFARAKKQFKLDRSAVLLTCSHTHSGPVVGLNLNVMFDFSVADKQRVEAYTAGLVDKLVSVIGDSLKDLSPAQLAIAHGSAGFTANRRKVKPTGVTMEPNPDGPVDHDVPVLRVTAPDGRLRAIFFGYACHNVTISPRPDPELDFYKIYGDYAGFAQLALEKSHPGTEAMFTILCGADQNPNPRGAVEVARQHGESLATAVDRALGAEMRPVRAPIRTAFQSVPLDFAKHTRQTFEDEIKKAEATKKSDSKFRKRRAEMMLAAYDKGRPIRQVPLPVQAIRFGQDLTILALGGEVVVDYALRSKREYPNENLIAVGYANDVMCYIPSKRVLKEGGYEVDMSMVFYGQPGPFAENVEERIFRAIHQVMQKAGAKPKP